MRVFSAEAWRARMSRVRTAMSGVARSLAAFLRRWDKDALARAEGEARRAERRLHDAIDILPEGLVFLDGEGRYILWNKRYAEMYHRSADLFAPGRRLADTLRIGVGIVAAGDADAQGVGQLATRREQVRRAVVDVGVGLVPQDVAALGVEEHDPFWQDVERLAQAAFRLAGVGSRSCNTICLLYTSPSPRD